MDALVGDVVSQINKEKEHKRSSGLMMLGLAALVFAASMLLLVYVYSNMTRPRIKRKKNIVMPPSVRRKLKKGT